MELAGPTRALHVSPPPPGFLFSALSLSLFLTPSFSLSFCLFLYFISLSFISLTHYSLLLPLLLCGWPKSSGRGKNHLGRRVPSLQTSLYRSLWGGYHVHRPLFIGHSSGLGNLPISLHRSHPMGRWQKKNQKKPVPYWTNNKF